MTKLNLREIGVVELSAEDLSLVEGGSEFSNKVSYWAGWAAGKIVNGLAAWSEAFNEGAKAGGPLIH